MQVAFAYVTDRRGFELAQYSAMSLALAHPAGCVINIFCHRFMPEAADGVFSRALRALGAELHFHPIVHDGLERHPTAGHVTKAALLRLTAVDTVAKVADRIVYLDTDTLIFAPLGIQNLDLQGKSIAAVLDMDLSDSGVFRDLRDEDFDEPVMRSRYFNSGVMIFDAARWGGANRLERFGRLLLLHDSGCRYKLNCTSNDQCACNALFEDDWLPLPFTYNFQASGKFTPGWKAAKVRHYCGSAKFLPVTVHRHDHRDLALIGQIGGLLKRPNPQLSFLRALAFRLNALRHYHGARRMHRFLIHAGFGLT